MDQRPDGQGFVVVVVVVVVVFFLFFVVVFLFLFFGWNVQIVLRVLCALVHLNPMTVLNNMDKYWKQFCIGNMVRAVLYTIL